MISLSLGGQKHTKGCDILFDSSIKTRYQRKKNFIIPGLVRFSMKTSTLLVVTSAMVLSILTSTGLFVGSSFAQENMTNSTNETGAMMGNQSESGTASGLENLTGGSAGNIGLLQNDTAIGSQNTSVTGGMEQEQEATETANATSINSKDSRTRQEE